MKNSEDREIGYYKVTEHEKRGVDRYKLSVWDGLKWGCSYHNTIEDAEDIGERVQVELLS